MNRLFLVDAMAMIYRAYFALQKNPRITSYGKNTNASFGFTNALVDILTNQKPTHLAVVFDSYAPTTRETIFADYKANRQSAPEELTDSLEDIKEIVRGFQIPIFEESGYEADDIIGTIALQFEHQPDIEVYMVTPDKDYGQLVRDNIFMLKPPFMGKGFEKIGASEVCAKWGLHSVHQVVDMLALMGDSSDNIPGIPGIGEKTASKLLQTYHSLEEILDNAATITGSVGEKIRAGKESAQMSKILATIIKDVPVHYTLDDCKIQTPDYPRLAHIFSQLEFQTLAKRILPKAKETQALSLFPTEEQAAPSPEKPPTAYATIATVPHQYHLVQTAPLLDTLLEQIEKAHHVGIDTETTGLDVHTDNVIGISFCLQSFEAYYVDLTSSEMATYGLEKIRTTLNRIEKEWIGHHLKFDLMVLKTLDIHLRGSFFDTMIAKYVIADPGKKSMDAMSMQYLDYQPLSYASLVDEKKGIHSLADVDIHQVKEYGAEDADITFQLATYLRPRVESPQFQKIFAQVDCPLIPVLADMEYEGMRIDDHFLNQYSQVLETELRHVEEQIYALSPIAFNINSPKQLGEVLFEKMKLPHKGQKAKTQQYSTGEEILTKLLHEHPIIPLILTYREIAKLKSTYVDAFPKLIHPLTRKIHTSFNQTTVVTGRLSSLNPNLQNIPIRTEKGKKMRQAFIPRGEDYVLLSADYSQIELRVIAAMSRDERMCRAFLDHQDIHASTASAVYHVPLDQVTPEMRYRAKSVNFGIIYGQQAWGLSEALAIPLPEAKALIESYFEQYPGIKNYMSEQIAFARKNGCVQTLLGRVRYLENILSKNQTVKGMAERNAINTPIQGTAADLIKLAMIDIHRHLTSRNMKSKLILQVHDELVIDTHHSEIEEVKKITEEKMIHALPLPNGVPIQVSIGIGNNWLESH